MNIEDVIDKLLEEEEYRNLFDKLKSYGLFDKTDVLTILLAISLMNEGKGEDSERLLVPLYEKNKESAELSYWYASALLLKAVTLEEFIEAKGIMLDALELGIKGKMRDDAVQKLSYAEEKIEELTL